jgi:citrate synthase
VVTTRTNRTPPGANQGGPAPGGVSRHTRFAMVCSREVDSEDEDDTGDGQPGRHGETAGRPGTGGPHGRNSERSGDAMSEVEEAQKTAAPASGTLTYNGTTLDLKVVPATEGASGVEIGKLLSTTGVVTLDPGYTNTGSTTSAITYIDGDAGILRYRGYPIEQLAQHSTFIETSYLLIYGELPTPDQLANFTSRISRHTLLHEDLKRFFDGFPRDAHPMPVLSSAVSALSTFYQDSLDPFNPEHVELSTVRLLAKLPTIAAYAYKKTVGQPLLYPDNSLGLVENFLRMSFGFPAEPYDVDPKLAKALDQLFILHADHEQNCSTSTVRLVGSAHANMFVSVASGINALFGPLHGGANEAVLQMLGSIRDDGGDIDKFVQRVKAKEPGVKLMGFGHRVYKNYDPRAAIVKQTADGILESLGANDELLDLAKQLEEVALHDDYFISRKLYPNVDFYTGLIYKAMGFPTKMFTVLFAIGRLPGWIAQWREMIEDPASKIGRPRQVYTGYTEREYLPSSER